MQNIHNMIISISPFYVEKEILTPIMNGKCKEAKKNLAELEEMVSKVREYFAFTRAVYVGVMDERTSVKVAECFGGKLLLNVIFLLDTNNPKPTDPMFVKFDTLEEMREFNEWLHKSNKIPFIPISERSLVGFKSLKETDLSSIPHITIKSIVDRSAGYHYEYMYPDVKEMIFRMFTEGFQTTLLSIDEVIEKLEEFKKIYPNNLEVIYGALIKFKTNNIIPNEKINNNLPQQYM